MISSILLAAGQSKRMQSENKLLKKYKKKHLINHILKSLIRSKVNKIIVVLGHENRKIKKIALKSKKIIFVVNSHYSKGISTSIKWGLKKISKKNIGFLIAHADMPLVSKTILNTLCTGLKNSKKTHANRCERLKEAGFSDEEINQIHGPIGIKLGGRAAPEIALSIIAQLVAETYKK